MTDITERLRSIYVAEGANYVQEAADLIECLRAERDQLVNDVHSCGPECTKAGCVNRRLREALTGVMANCRYSCIQGIWHWHERGVPPIEKLYAARAALGETK